MRKYTLSAFADEAGSSIDEQINALNAHNIKKIELRNIDGKGVVTLDISIIKNVSNKLKANGITLSAIGSPIGKIGILDNFNEHLEDLKRVLEVSGILNTDKIRMFSFFIPKNANASDYKNEVIDRIGAIIELSKKYNVKCCLENEKDIFGDTKDRLLELFRVFSGELFYAFDPANFIQCGENPIDVYRKLKPYISYFHIKDAVSPSGDNVPAGYGDCSIEMMLNDFEKSTILTLEPHLFLFDGFANLKDDKSLNNRAYKSGIEAFDTAVIALKNILKRNGIIYE